MQNLTMNHSRMEMWSATPTPFNDDLSVDRESVCNLIKHHQRLDVTGLMLGGTCGEGPWMTLDDLCELTDVARTVADERMRLAVQVSDNSVRRVLDRIQKVCVSGAQIAVISPPFLMMNSTPKRLLDFFRKIIQNSPIPVGVYDRGKAANYCLNDEMLEEMLTEPNLVLIKDSSSFQRDRASMIARVRALKPDLRILCGDEFACIEPIQHGYDGLFLGGAIFNANIARALMIRVRAGDRDGAREIQLRMNELMLRIYGGEKITCWLSGLKYLLVQMGIFTTIQSHLEYPLTEECRGAIDEMVTGNDRSGYRDDLMIS